MTTIWLPAALLGGLFQAWRTALQQRLRAELTVSGAGLVRYAFGAPVALALLARHLAWRGEALPGVAAAFWPLAALVALVVVMAMQTAMHGTWVAWREPATWRAVWVSRRPSAQVGLLAALGSACWFTGFATAPVALVRVIGQVEVFATLGFGHFYLREPLRLREMAGLLLVGAGVVLALVGSLGH